MAMTFSPAALHLSLRLQWGDGLLTDGTGAVSADACFVPSGFGTDINTCCLHMFFCLQCGDGLLTDGTGAVSADACYVPAGYGVVRAEGSDTVSAVMCVQNMFGRSAPNHDLRTTR
jgi:hypothetical protein